MYFHYFVIISPWKRAGPFIWTNLNPLNPVEIGPVVLKKMMKMWKVYEDNDNNDYNNDNDGQGTNFDEKSSLEPSTQ